MSSYHAEAARGGGMPPQPPGDWPASEVTDALYAVIQAIPDLRVAIAHRLGLNPSEVDAMEHIMGNSLGPVELSRRLHMTSASSTVLVDRLEQAGHVVREPDPADGRRRVLRPTAQGANAVFGEIGPLVTDLVEAEEGLSARERAVVVKYLSRVLEVLEQHTNEE